MKLDKKILIIEDEKDILFLLAESFRSAGFSVCTALDGQEGIEAAEKEKPDLMLVDILIPKMDGVTMVKKIRETGTSVPVIFLTNLSDPEHISKAIEMKNSDYIIKSDTQTEDIISMAKKRLRIKK